MRTRLILGVGLVVVLVAGWGGWVLRQRQTVRPVPILMYHNIAETEDDVWTVCPEELAAHLRFLREAGYTSVRPSDLAANRRWGRPLPRKPIILTFDDGYAEGMRRADALMAAEGFRGVCYLITGWVAADPAARQSYRDQPILTWPEVKALRSGGRVTFGCHSRHHANLAGIGPGAEQEIVESRADVRKVGGFEPDSFCYPFGQYNKQVVAAVRRAGFAAALICEDRVAQTGPGMDLFELPRVSVMGGRHTFAVERQPGAGDRCVVTVRNAGLPIPVRGRLVAAGLPDAAAWQTPVVELGSERVTWSWSLPEAARGGPWTLELWDPHRVLRLHRAELGAATSP